MEQETVQLVLSKLDEVVKLAGGKIGEFYPYVVRQQIVEGVLCIAGFIITTTLAIVVWRLANKYQKKINEENIEEIVVVLLFILGASALIFLIVSVFSGIPKLINPHFFAVKDLLEMIT